MNVSAPAALPDPAQEIPCGVCHSTILTLPGVPLAIGQKIVCPHLRSIHPSARSINPRRPRSTHSRLLAGRPK